ncbi:galactokinase family protein [Eggerthia catenaformis]|uniref:galactokinase n=1 Tax=Eggerthia catenaformis TaxID=31973 RepID=UPI0028EA7300|nr:galactokinase family protein [Eggerthia catenaformis]
MNIQTLIKQLESQKHNQILLDLYGDASLIDYQNKRYIQALKEYQHLYGDDDIEMYTAAGRSEVGGNHTDHQHGRVLAAAINLDAIAVVSKQKDIIKVVSDDFNIKEIDINDLEKKKEEEGTSAALIKGVVSRLKELGYSVGGFKAYITSDVLIGAGLSSSAAFEDLIGTIIDGLYNNMSIDMVTIAKAGQYAENVYFGKPCGLMDQCACAVGGLISIDFKDPYSPLVEPIDIDFGTFHHSLCIVDTKGSHASLTNEYAAIPREMKSIAHVFDEEYLRDVDEENFMERIADLRIQCGDRAVLRAYHFFKENKRVEKLVEALKKKDFNLFKHFVASSGNSSYKYLQNVFTTIEPHHQPISIGLAISEDILGDKGVCRVHGGGFAGTIQAFVSDNYVQIYQKEIEKVFGKGSCHVLKIRKYGGKKIFD